mgnify:FL=1
MSSGFPCAPCAYDKNDNTFCIRRGQVGSACFWLLYSCAGCRFHIPAIFDLLASVLAEFKLEAL